MKILNGLESTETGVKVDPQLMTEVDLWQRIYGSNGLKTDIFPIDCIHQVFNISTCFLCISGCKEECYWTEDHRYLTIHQTGDPHHCGVQSTRICV